MSCLYLLPNLLRLRLEDSHLLGDREGHYETGPVSRGALNSYLSVLLFHDPLRDGQPKPGPLGLCGKERLKNPIQVFLRDSCAFVFNHHSQKV